MPYWKDSPSYCPVLDWSDDCKARENKTRRPSFSPWKNGIQMNAQFTRIKMTRHTNWISLFVNNHKLTIVSIAVRAEGHAGTDDEPTVVTSHVATPRSLLHWQLILMRVDWRAGSTNQTTMAGLKWHGELASLWPARQQTRKRYVVAREGVWPLIMLSLRWWKRVSLEETYAPTTQKTWAVVHAAVGLVETASGDRLG